MTSDDRASHHIRMMAQALEGLAAGQLKVVDAMQQLSNGQQMLVSILEEISRTQGDLGKSQGLLNEIVGGLGSAQEKFIDTQQAVVRVLNQLQVDIATLIEKE